MATELQQNRSHEYMRPIVQGWRDKRAECVRARRSFDAVATQCTAFYEGSVGFMWDKSFTSKYMGTSLSPQFKITLNKAFEFIALYGPYLYWRNPTRVVTSRKQLKLTPEMFGAEGDPVAEQIFQQAAAEEAARDRENDITSQLLNLYLNYTPDEMPHGGLAQHSELAITEALISGRGVLWPEPYTFPASDRVLTGCRWGSQWDLLIDPDATGLHDALYIMRTTVAPFWEVERKFGLPYGSLRGKGVYESQTSQAESTSIRHSQHLRNRGAAKDLIEYTEVWSKMGVGARLPGMDSPLLRSFDEVLGDYCYIAIMDGVDYPLNAPSNRVSMSLDEDIVKMFQWPIPYWLDSRWPCAILDFYRRPKFAWPIAPLGPGLGELMYLNVFISHLAGRIRSSTRDFIAVLESASAHLEPVLRGGSDLAILKIPGIFKDVKNAVSFLQQPQVNADAWHIIDRIMVLFEKRVGLNELMYGLSATQSRSATDAEAKREATSIRPDYMAGKVEEWMAEAADMEKFCAWRFVEGQNISELVGHTGSMMWDHYITNAEPESVVRQMRCRIEGNSARKPNRQKQVQDINSVLGVLFPEFSKQADVTGDTSSINALIEKWAEALDMDPEGLLMGERIPWQAEQENSPEQQAATQLEMEKQKAEIEKTLAQAESERASAAEMESSSESTVTSDRMKQLQFAFDQANAEQEQEYAMARDLIQMDQNAAAMEQKTLHKNVDLIAKSMSGNGRQ